MKRAQLARMRRHKSLFVFDGKKIPYYFWSHADDTEPDTLLLLGAGQINRIPKWVATAAGPGVVVAQGLPYWHAGTESQELEAFVRAYCHAVLEAVQKTFGMQKLHLVAESQATVGAIQLALDKPRVVRHVALALPMGLTVQELGTTPEERFKEFRRRALRSLQRRPHSLGAGLRDAYIWLLFARLALVDKRSSERKYALGVSFDITELLRQLALQQKAARKHLTLLLGANDLLFPPSEVIKALKQSDVPYVSVVTVPETGHTSLGVHAGQRMLDELIRTVRQA